MCVVQDFLDKRRVSGSELFLAVAEYMISNAIFSTHFAHRLGKKKKKKPPALVYHYLGEEKE